MEYATQARAEKAAQDAMCAMLGFMETTLALAAPKLMAKAGRVPSRQEILDAIDQYLAFYPSAKANPASEEGKEQIRVEPLARKLREQLSNWTPTKQVPLEIVA